MCTADAFDFALISSLLSSFSMRLNYSSIILSVNVFYLKGAFDGATAVEIPSLVSHHVVE